MSRIGGISVRTVYRSSSKDDRGRVKTQPGVHRHSVSGNTSHEDRCVVGRAKSRCEKLRIFMANEDRYASRDLIHRI